MHNHPEISVNTVVVVRRTVKQFRDTNEQGPKTIHQAVRDGDLDSSSGTVSVEFVVADGEHAGANAYQSKNGRWHAQYDPLTQHPNGSRRDLQ